MNDSILIRLSKELKAKLQKLADDEALTLSAFIRTKLNALTKK